MLFNSFTHFHFFHFPNYINNLFLAILLNTKNKIYQATDKNRNSELGKGKN